MNVLFLDVDGVLNNSIRDDDFCKFNMQNLKELCSTIPFKIVLSSDWRRNMSNVARVRSELMFIGLDLFGKTPILKKRKEEIEDWLVRHTGKWEKALIIDDMDGEECDPKMDNVTFFQTNWRLGLTFEDIEKICVMMK